VSDHKHVWGVTSGGQIVGVKAICVAGDCNETLDAIQIGRRLNTPLYEEMSEPLVERLHAFFVRVFTTHDLFDKDLRQEMKIESFALDDKVEQLEIAYTALKQAAKEAE